MLRLTDYAEYIFIRSMKLKCEIIEDMASDETIYSYQL